MHDPYDLLNELRLEEVRLEEFQYIDMLLDEYSSGCSGGCTLVGCGCAR